MEYAALLLVLVVALLGYRHVWRRARARPGPVSCTVEASATGWVELRGRVRGVGSVRSPLTGRSVVGYSVRVDEEQGITAWRAVVEQCRVGDFELEDDTGRILVRASVSDIELETKLARGKGGPFRMVPRRVAELLHRHGRPVAGVLFARAFRWRERVLEEGARVRVRGWVAEAEHDGGGSLALAGNYREFPRRLAVIGGGARPLQVSADD